MAPPLAILFSLENWGKKILIKELQRAFGMASEIVYIIIISSCTK